MVTIRGELCQRVAPACAREGLIAHIHVGDGAAGTLYAPGRQDDEPVDLDINAVSGVQVCHLRPKTELGELFMAIVMGELA